MIITTEMALAAGMCPAGNETSNLNSLSGRDYNEIVETLRSINQTSFAAWVVVNKGKFITMTPNYRSGRFRVRTIKGDNFVYFNSLEEAKTKFIELKNEYFEEEKDRFTVTKETILANGDALWEVIDINNVTEIARYKVFNHTTGLHEDFSDSVNAKNRVDELKTEFLNFQHAVEQEVFTEDGSLSGWIEVGTTAP